MAAEKLMNETPVGAAVEGAKQQAMAAMGDAGAAALRGLGGLFGRK
jgi:hypothetical protein